ncbi:MAG: GDSL-type esterase/lipase family protein [Acidobacteria bacterium]|nr:GDSL-type esterase/lipase family protein [Acidobacteriota bacterium]
MRRAGSALALLLASAVFALAPAAAQTLSGAAFHDRNGNGLRDAGEEALTGVAVRVAGQRDAGGAFDQSVSTATDGAFAFSPGNGCYIVDLEDPPGWRRSYARTDEFAQGSAGYAEPAGVRRVGAGMALLETLLGGSLRYTSMGDSIAWNWNSCFDTSTFWYSRQVRDRLRCVAPSATVALDEAAVKGEHTDDLLVDDSDLNSVFRVIDAQSKLVTISIIGNDLLNAEPPDNPTQEQVNRAVAEILDARQNLQEILSSLVAGIPGATIELNTLYDNLAYNCATANSSAFHREWVPLVNRILREVAWGQARRVTSAEVNLEFAHEDLLNSCTGFQNRICQLFGDRIHPTAPGYAIIREKVWESIGGANLGPKDGNGATSLTGLDHGYLQRVLRLYPTAWEARSGAQVTDPAAAFSEGDGGAGASIRLGIGSEEARFSGFPSWYDEVVPVKVVAGLRYRTTGTVSDDLYRIEASVNDQFRPPAGHPYSATNWIFSTPIVGGGGPNAPAEGPDYPSARLLVRPNVPAYREASATLMKNPVPSPSGRGYDWPAVTRAELGTAAVRVVAAPQAGTPGDDYRVVVDAAWLDVYGTVKPRPGEVTGVTVTRLPDGGLEVAFDQLAGSELYNLYFGDAALLASQGRYDHGARARCAVATTAAGPGRLKTTVPAAEVPAIFSYLVVTGRADGVESPAGFASSGAERDRSQNGCP